MAGPTGRPRISLAGLKRALSRKPIWGKTLKDHAIELVAPEAPAKSFYKRVSRLSMAKSATAVHLDRQTEKALRGAYRALKRQWQHLSGYGSFWFNHHTELRKRFFGKGHFPVTTGRCHDFAPCLMEEFIGQGIPRGAMSLVICHIRHADGTEEPHMVLALETTEGTMICCNIKGCQALNSPCWNNYRFLVREAHGGMWETLGLPVNLAEAIKGRKSA